MEGVEGLGSHFPQRNLKAVKTPEKKEVIVTQKMTEVVAHG